MSEASSFDEFYRGSYRRNLLYAYALTGDLADAQDVVQEAYVRAWQRWSHLQRYDDPEMWVRTVAWRLAANRWRALRNATRLWARLGVSTEVDEPSPDTVTLIAALRRLPDAQRRAIVLHHLRGLSVEEVAAEVDVPVNTVKSRLARGRAALAPLVADTSVSTEVRDG
jgi:RNA polymerase sigma-70 factor, ECF subfamily